MIITFDCSCRKLAHSKATFDRNLTYYGSFNTSLHLTTEVTFFLFYRSLAPFGIPLQAGFLVNPFDDIVCRRERRVSRSIIDEFHASSIVSTISLSRASARKTFRFPFNDPMHPKPLSSFPLSDFLARFFPPRESRAVFDPVDDKEILTEISC